MGSAERPFAGAAAERPREPKTADGLVGDKTAEAALLFVGEEKK